MRKRMVVPPLTVEQLKEKVKSGKILAPAGKFPIEGDGSFENPEFTSVEFGGVFSRTAEEMVEAHTHKSHRYPGSMGFVFNWVAKGIGFGQFTLNLLDNGQLEVDTETLGKEFFKKALCFMVDSAKDKSEKAN